MSENFPRKYTWFSYEKLEFPRKIVSWSVSVFTIKYICSPVVPLCVIKMLWRCNWRQVKRSRKVLRALAFFSIHRGQPPKAIDTHGFSRENGNRNDGFPGVSLQALEPDTVYSVLRNCPSDLLALSFFMWCAKQNNYFHNAQAFDYMVGAVQKLTVNCEGIRGVITGLESVGCVIKAQVFLLLLRIYWRGGIYDKVFEVYEEMCNFGYVPNTFAQNVVMDVLFKIGRVDVALRVLKENSLPNFLSFNIALCNLCKVGDFVNLKDVIRMMLTKGFHPNNETFELILNGFCKRGRLAEGLQVLGLMICLGIPVHVNVWSMLINGFFRSGKPGRAVELFNKMLEIGLSPSIVSYSILIKGFVSSGMASDALGMMDTVKSKGLTPDLVLLNIMIDSLTKMGRYDDALDIYVGLLEQKLVPDSYTFASVISNICLSRRFPLLPTITSGIATEADLFVCNALLNYFCKAGYPSFAVKLYSDMIDSGFTLDNHSFTGLLYALCGEGRVNEAIRVYKGMVMNFPGLDAHVHTAIIDGLIKIGKYDQAICLFRQCILKKYPIDVVSYSVAIKGLVLTRRIEEAYSLFSQMKEDGVSPNAQTYKMILSGLCKEKDTEKVKQLLREVIKEEIELDLNTQIRVYIILSRSCKDLSEFSQFFETWSSGLINSKAISAPGFVASNSGRKVASGDLLQENDMFRNFNGTDDFPVVAASVG